MGVGDYMSDCTKCEKIIPCIFKLCVLVGYRFFLSLRPLGGLLFYIFRNLENSVPCVTFEHSVFGMVSAKDLNGANFKAHFTRCTYLFNTS
jgi:hypothetical protein